jgi:hypothetical protein
MTQRLAGRIGVEHEYALARGPARVDVRDLLPSVALPGRRIDPGDRQAIRTELGVVLTADGREAEVATPPVTVGPGMADAIGAWCDAAERLLRGAVADEIGLAGVSTHWNVELPTSLARRLGPVFARRFGVPLLLLTERVDADGLLVRPRAGRLELGTDYASGDDRRAASVLAAGGVAACASVLLGRRAARSLPPLVAARLAPARERFGWYLDRRIGGHDLLTGGRSTPLHLVGGGTTTAGEQLAVAAAAACEALADQLAPTDAAALVALADGSSPLALERGAGRDVHPTGAEPPSSCFGRALRVHHRDGYTCAATIATWWVTVFVLDGVRRGHVVVPTAHLERFLDDLEAGRLDATVDAFLRSPPCGRTVRGWPDLDRVRFCDELPRPGAFVPPERNPAGLFEATWDPTSPSPSDAGADHPRVGKTVVPVPVTVPDEPEHPGRPSRPWWPWVALVVVAMIGTGFVVLGGGGGSTTPASTAPPVATTVVTETTTNVAVTTTSSTTTTTSSVTTTTVPRRVSGTYTGSVTVADDPAGHACCVDPNTTWEVLQTRNTETGVITLTLTGVFDDVVLVATIPGTGAPVDMATTATIAGFPGTEVRFQGTVTPDGGVVGTLTVGGNGTLPTGRAITFAVDLSQVVS